MICYGKGGLQLKTSSKLRCTLFFSYSTKQEAKNSSKDSGEMVAVTLVGETSDIASFKKYVDKIFIHPEIIEIFSYDCDLEVIFQNAVWIEVFEESYGVCISVRPDYEVNISGPESSVSSTVAAMEELIAKYCDCKDTLYVNSEKSLANQLVTALMACKKAYVSARIFEGIPNDVIKLLLSMLERTYKDSFPKSDDSMSLDDSVVVIDAPEKNVDISLIVLDSDSEDETSSKRSLENGTTKNAAKNKKRKLSREKKLKKKKNRALQNVNDVQKGNSSPAHAGCQNDDLPCPKTESSVDKGSPPKIENPGFIPLTLDSTSDDRSACKILPQQDYESSGEAQVKDEEIEVVTEDIPKPPRRLRPVIIDGCNVALYATLGRREDFSWKRIELSMKYFLDRGHDVKVFLPQYRRPLCYEKSGNQDYVEDLENRQLVVFTPSRRIDGRTVSCYDDRFIVDLASRNGGIIFSNDNYRDLINENVEFAKTIKQRLLMYVFAGDELMIPEDPLGKNGPRLEEFLSFPPDK